MGDSPGRRARARELRSQGWSVNDLAEEFGVARFTAWRWVRDLPLDRDTDRARSKRERAAAGIAAYWEGRRRELGRHADSVRALAADRSCRVCEC